MVFIKNLLKRILTFILASIISYLFFVAIFSPRIYKELNEAIANSFLETDLMTK